MDAALGAGITSLCATTLLFIAAVYMESWLPLLVAWIPTGAVTYLSTTDLRQRDRFIASISSIALYVTGVAVIATVMMMMMMMYYGRNAIVVMLYVLAFALGSTIVGSAGAAVGAWSAVYLSSKLT